jgi:hypothetical protein
MYSWLCAGVKPAAATLVAAALAGAQTATSLGPMTCDARLAALFTPLRPQRGRYEVCTTPRPLTSVAEAGWAVEEVPPLDAFGTAGPYNRAAVARLYGGRRATVSRGWVEQDGRFEAITLISPYPDATLTTLESGTLVIRYFLVE